MIQVTSSYGNSYHQGDHVESGNFAFTAAEAGDYTACFWSPDHNPPATVTVEFEWKTGVVSKDWTKVAKKGQVDVSDCYKHFTSSVHQYFAFVLWYLSR